MDDAKAVILKKGREKAILNKHHWIFSGAIERLPEFEDGEILQVLSSERKLLGSGYFNKKAKIIGRMLCFDESQPVETLFRHMDQALALREELFRNKPTTAYRLVNGEGDLAPGLIVDRYHDALVIQFSTLGMEKLRQEVVGYLKRKLNPRLIYEKSNLPSRREEGLQDQAGLLLGEGGLDVEIQENGLQFEVSLVEGQKTGFFLDHREMRQKIREMAAKKRVLNCFAYTGGFSVYAAAGGASGVDSVDISQKAVVLGERNMQINGFQGDKYRFYAEDVFEFLRKKDLDYEIVILDPPAFAKRQKDVIQACRGYKDINRLAMQKMPKGSYLLTCSCSYHVDEELFKKVLFQASVEAKREVKIVGRHSMAGDHPVNLCHPESDYLKSFLLYVS